MTWPSVPVQSQVASRLGWGPMARDDRTAAPDATCEQRSEVACALHERAVLAHERRHVGDAEVSYNHSGTVVRVAASTGDAR